LTIDAYLASLRRRLPLLGRRRALAEVREHLRDSAARHRASGLEPDAAEVAAVREFGDVDEVGRRFAAELAVVETRVASTLALGAVAFFVFPLYVVPENTLPPAQWIEKPTDIAMVQAVAVGSWLAALGVAVLGAVAAWTRWPRLAGAALPTVAVAIAVAGATGAALVVRWFEAEPATPEWPLLALPTSLASLGVCALAAVWAGRRRRLLAY
jgi:hypothetical protein